ncbi:MFS transporter [Novosphingobium sp. 9]|uniref:MFS transporter n=1 Tax=Novosphingobium sp. 9 TaxID=2025349 RepID=UPI0021B6D6B4|nr:MFS transporter [Novosphingobium sp. 9]
MTTHEAASVSKMSIIVAALSTIVEWYDFTLYLYFATVISRVFFGQGNAALASTLGGFAVAYLMRPLGAAVFGHIGDRFGRRRMMLISMGLMSLAMLATACLPTRAMIGHMAGILLVVLRCAMGFSVGGEYTGVVAYLLESAPSHRRGLVTSLAAAASEVGGLLAAAVCTITVSLMSPQALTDWGWRIPFFLGALLAVGLWIARSFIEETPTFQQQVATGRTPRNPLFDALRHHRRAIAQGFAISALGSITYYIGITYVPTFLTHIGRMQEVAALRLSTAAALAVIAITPLVGIAADRIGRRPVLLTVCLCAIPLPIALFATMSGNSSSLILGSVLLLAVLGGAVSAVGAVTTAELFPTASRLSGLAIGATGATAIFGGLAPYTAQLLSDKLSAPLVPGMMIAFVAIVVLPILLGMSETGLSNRTAV